MYEVYTRITTVGNLKMLFLIVALFCCQPPVRAGTLEERQAAVDVLFDGPCAEYQVPKVLALAIARQESSMHPWIINISGRDIRPSSKDDAVRIATWALQNKRSFDVGIMQINAYWIKKYGWALDTVLEPVNNVKIGVWILAKEIRRHGLNWKAVAYYHTPLHRNPERGQDYARRIIRHLKNILAENTTEKAKAGE